MTLLSRLLSTLTPRLHRESAQSVAQVIADSRGVAAELATATEATEAAIARYAQRREGSA
jgi:hypothetical protein